MSKHLITVFGATGNQGGSVILFWASHPELKAKYDIRAVTRDSSKASAQALLSQGVEVVEADLNDSGSLDRVVAGAYGVYAVTQYWELRSKEKEVNQGTAIADASFLAGVKHLVWSSLPNTTKLTNGKLAQIDHFTSKAEVEEYIETKKPAGTWASYVMPGYFMSNFQNLGLVRRGPDGLAFNPPYASSAKHGLVDIKRDTGAFVWGVIEAGEAADGKEIHAASDWRTGDEIVGALSAGGAEKVSFHEVSHDVYKAPLAAKMGDYIAEEMTQHMELIGEYSYYGKGAEKKQDESDHFLYKGHKKTTFAEFVEKNKPWKFD